MSRIIPVAGFLLFVPCLFGCGLFGGSKSYQFQELPPYYQSERDKMIDHAKIYRQSELSRLEQAATEFESEKRKEETIAAEREEKEKKKRKSRQENWFGKGDGTFLMSNEAKRINSNLER